MNTHSHVAMYIPNPCDHMYMYIYMHVVEYSASASAVRQTSPADLRAPTPYRCLLVSSPADAWGRDSVNANSTVQEGSGGGREGVLEAPLHSEVLR